MLNRTKKLFYKYEWESFLLFTLPIFIMLFLSMQGKYISSKLFTDRESFFNAEYFSFDIILFTVFIIVLMHVIFKHKDIKLKNIFLVGILVSLVFPFYVQIRVEFHSMLILSLQIYILAIGTIIAVLKQSNIYSLSRNNLELVLDKVSKLISLLLVLFVAGAGILRFISETIGEDEKAFMTTLLYPTLILAISIFLLCYWLVIPSYNKIIEHN